MNWTLFTAGAVMLIGSGLHFVVGDAVLRKIESDQLPPNPFGGSPADTRVGLRITWHFGTIAFAFLGAWLIATELQPQAAFAVALRISPGH